MRPIARSWRTPLGSFIGEYGVDRLTADLAAAGQPVTRTAVYNWIGGRHAPRPDCAVQITRLSEGRVSLADIYLQRDVVKAGE